MTTKRIDIVAPCDGKIVGPEAINDLVFSQEAIGKTIAILPSDGMIVSPIDGILESIYPTGHAFTIKNGGLGILVHIGIDTIHLHGAGYKLYHQKGDVVKKGELIVKADLKLIAERGYDPVLIIVIAENNDDLTIDYIKDKIVACGERINI